MFCSTYRTYYLSLIHIWNHTTEKSRLMRPCFLHGVTTSALSCAYQNNTINPDSQLIGVQYTYFETLDRKKGGGLLMIILQNFYRYWWYVVCLFAFNNYLLDCVNWTLIIISYLCGNAAYYSLLMCDKRQYQ